MSLKRGSLLPLGGAFNTCVRAQLKPASKLIMTCKASHKRTCEKAE